MATIRKIGLVSIFTIVGLCLFGILFTVFEKDIYKWWVSQTIPKPSTFQIDISRRTTIQVPKGIEWFGTRWTDDGKYVEVYDSRSQGYADTLMVIDPKSPTSNNDIELVKGENILGVTNELPFTLEDRESLWAGCEKENLFFTSKYIENNLWETRLWKGNQLVKTFQPIEFSFELYQSGFNDDPVGLTIEYSHFSPDCRYSVFSFSTDVWLLDAVEKTFSLIFTARQSKFNLLDKIEGIHQSIMPTWSPNSQEFAFGDYTFGLEKYNIQTKERNWLLAPSIAGGFIKWSKSGNWILAYSEEGLVIISPTGDKMGILDEDCGSKEDIAWSSNDKIAFICKDYNRDTCVEGKCPDEQDYLVIWDLSNLDGN